jgi:hypothetical protein
MQQDIFKEAAIACSQPHGAMRAEIMLRTADFSLALGARSVWMDAIVVAGHTFAPYLRIENNDGEMLTFDMNGRRYEITTYQWGEHAAEEFSLYLQALGIIREFCAAAVTQNKVKEDNHVF